jgi:hypothetical protein
MELIITLPEKSLGILTDTTRRQGNNLLLTTTLNFKMNIAESILGNFKLPAPIRRIGDLYHMQKVENQTIHPPTVATLLDLRTDFPLMDIPTTLDPQLIQVMITQESMLHKACLRPNTVVIWGDTPSPIPSLNITSMVAQRSNILYAKPETMHTYVTTILRDLWDKADRFI